MGRCTCCEQRRSDVQTFRSETCQIVVTHLYTECGAVVPAVECQKCNGVVLAV